MKIKVLFISLTVLILVALSLILLRSCNSSSGGVIYETARVRKGSVRITVTATGTIQAIQTVKVGTQVSGKISRIYADYNSRVKMGDLLAELDRKPLETQLTISQAALDDAQAVLTYQTATYNRTKALFEKKLIAESAYDEALYNFQKARIQIKTSQLNYDQSKINLGYAFIYSPIDGVILERAVTEGQTVAASYSTPTLFTIAHDLTQMQVEASVDEADIGYVKQGQRVSFTVDAYPDNKFTGEVTQIRLQPVTTSNVVTYTVIIRAPNKELKLMPGMTASITAYVNEANDVLTVSSQVLQYKPEGQPAGPPAPPGETAKKEVWVKNGKSIHPVFIETGLDDDLNVQILSGLREGDEVVISSTAGASSIGLATAKKDTSESSPFMPKPPKRNGKNPGPPPG
ncbi:MAG: efflux RND transporter periplasmic adaptor subunit [Bacteroidetes bacterium]|nr:efflux RND transporter periplasmic adaptor subunit [Bacteroidota bacterium]